MSNFAKRYIYIKKLNTIKVQDEFDWFIDIAIILLSWILLAIINMKWKYDMTALNSRVDMAVKKKKKRKGGFWKSILENLLLDNVGKVWLRRPAMKQEQGLNINPILFQCKVKCVWGS